MKIMLVTRVWPTQRGGGMPFVCYDRAVELARQGHEVHVVTTSLSPKANLRGKAQDREEEGVTVHYTDAPAHEWSRSFAESCLWWARQLHPHVIHSESFDRDHQWWTAPGLPGVVACTMHGVRFGTWLTKWNGYRALEYGPEPFPHEWVRAEAQGLATFDRVFGVSLWEERIMRDQYGLTNSSVVYNPIPPYFFTTPRPDYPDRQYFLCASVTGANARGFTQALKAAAKAGVELKVVSGVSREKMVAVYDKAHAIVLPTTYAQGYDLTIAEGRARGVPAIMTPTGSYLDESRHWDWPVPLGDEAALVQAMTSHIRPLVSPESADRHRPEEHVALWLNALGV